MMGTPDVSKEKKGRLPLHVMEKRAAEKKRFQGLKKGFGALLLLVFLMFTLHRLGPTATKHLQPAALQNAFHEAVRDYFLSAETFLPRLSTRFTSLGLHRPRFVYHCDALQSTQGEFGGIVLYVAAFCVGEVLHLPGILFVAAGVLVWGCAWLHHLEVLLSQFLTMHVAQETWGLDSRHSDGTNSSNSAFHYSEEVRLRQVSHIPDRLLDRVLAVTHLSWSPADAAADSGDRGCWAR